MDGAEGGIIWEIRRLREKQETQGERQGSLDERLRDVESFITEEKTRRAASRVNTSNVVVGTILALIGSFVAWLASFFSSGTGKP